MNPSAKALESESAPANSKVRYLMPENPLDTRGSSTMNRPSRPIILLLAMIVPLILSSSPAGAEAVLTETSFTDDFSPDKSLIENHPITSSASPYWWVNSGGYAYWENGVGRTVYGDVAQPNDDPRLASYQPKANTDYGEHPQNIFRFVQRGNWGDYRQTMYYKIDRYIMSPNGSRTGHNGLLLFNRFIDSYNLYYTGIRVDGRAVIKKKTQGNYKTLANPKVLPGTWNRDTNPNLIPEGTWIGVRSEIKNVGAGVSIKVFLDIGRTGQWELIAEAFDDESQGGLVLTEPAHAGVRTDFMDVSFDDYEIIDLDAIGTDPPLPDPQADPVVDAGLDRIVSLGSSVSLLSASFTDANAGDTHSAIIDWGDGTVVPGNVNQTSGIVSGIHTYASAGAYSGTVTVMDDNGGAGTDVFNVTVNSTEADLTVIPGPDQTVVEGSSITLSGASFSDSGSAQTHTAVIDWGDGLIEPVQVFEETGEISGSHSYLNDGTFSPTITVMGDDQAVGSGSFTVNVNNANPMVTAGADITATAGSSVQMSPASYSDLGVLDVHSATINWGDGTVSPAVIHPTVKTITGSHTYQSAGSYTVRVTVIDDAGGAGSDSLSADITAVSSPPPDPDPTPDPDPGTGTGTSFIDDFSDSKSLTQATKASDSDSPYWWVTLGAYAYWENGVGRTVLGDVPQPNSDSKLASYQTRATADYGEHPQNIFRMRQMQTWGDYRQTMYYNIDRYNLSSSSARTGHNGLLQFNRQVGGDLYYTGLRVDGRAIIKKKTSSGFKTLRSVKVLPGTWNRDTNPNLIPENTWVGVRTEVENVGPDVSIKVYTDIGRTGQWELVAEALDDGSIGGAPLTAPGTGGVRTDFMDVFFDDYEIRDLNGAPAPDPTPAPADPVVEAGPDQTAVEGSTVSLDSVSFTDVNVDDTHTATIDWGDGTVSDGTVDQANSTVSGSHSYSDDGSLQVVVTVTDNAGGVGSDLLTIDVTNSQPVVTSGSSKAISEGSSVELSGVTFSDAGSSDTHVATVDWGDGTIDPVAVSQADGSLSASHTYLNDGTYSPVITVIDDDQGIGNGSFDVTVSNVAPVVVAGGDLTAVEGQEVSLSSASFSDVGALDTHTATVDWGDGTIDSVTVSQADGSLTASHTYLNDGSYSPVITVIDDDQGIGNGSFDVTVSNVAPVVVAGDDLTVVEGQEVSLSSASFSDVGALDTHTATVDWGDGTIDSVTVSQADGGLTASHTYVDDGSFMPVITMIDDSQGVGTSSFAVTVTNATPVVVAGDDLTAEEGTEVSLSSASFSDVGALDTHIATVDWGDGVVGPASIDESTGVISAAHTYQSAGTYSVVVSVQDDDGGVGSATVSAVITAVTPPPAPEPKVFFSDDFSQDMTLGYSRKESQSANPFWWVRSGSYAYWENGTGRTVMGDVPISTTSDRLFLNYKRKANTDYGLHPQNVFRMTQRQDWQNAQQTAYYKIDRYNLTPVSSRTAHNGLMQSSREVDSKNLYYTGLRVDGRVVIKKKTSSNYSTLRSVKVLPGTWNRDTNPNLIPENTWVGIRTEMVNVGADVHIKVYTDIGRTGQWELAAEVLDDGSVGGAPHTAAGVSGLRTDFMDAYFDDFKIVDLDS